MRGLFVGILGAGRSGIAAARLARRLGATVLISDRQKVNARLPKGIKKESGRHSDRLLDCDLIIRSPGIPNHLPILKKIHRHGIPVWSELELASVYAKASHVIAITGTNGKTTTTTLVGKLFKATGQPTVVAGNIGTPLSDVAQKTSLKSRIVLEVSSYQLEDIHTFHPTISAVLNVTPDHLEHHGSMKAYAKAKARIFENQTSQDVCVLNADDSHCRAMARRCKARVFWFSRKKKLASGIYWEPSPVLRSPSPRGRGLAAANLLPRGEGGDRPDEGFIVVNWRHMHHRWTLKSNLPGAHNVENVLAAVAMALCGGVPLSTIRQVLSDFKGVEHRLEFVRKFHGVRYINDSKGTNVDSTRVALASFSDPLVVIMGGEGKGSPYSPLKSLIKKTTKRLLLIGEDSPVIDKAFRGLVPIDVCHTLDRAVARARVVSEPGDVVLLSPACASFDQYRNYEERGRHFKDAVRKLR